MAVEINISDQKQLARKAKNETVGLRDRQRSKRRRRIMAAARQLFNTSGYEETTLDQIAAKSEISTVTVLKYFGSKGGLLVAIQAQFEQETSDRFAPLIANPPEDPILAVCTFFRFVFENALSTMNRQVWKHMWAILFLEAGTEIGRGLATNERGILEKLILLLEKIQCRKHLRVDVDVRQLGEILYNLEAMRAMQFMSDPSISQDKLDILMRDDFVFVLKGYMD